MLKRTLSLSLQRSIPQALVWYLCYVLICVAICGLTGGLFATGLTPRQTFCSGAVIGHRTAVLLIIAIGLLLLRHRDKSILNFAFAVAGLLISVYVGAVGGLIPLTVLTTRPSNLGL